jgi:hypothetical protein
MTSDHLKSPAAASEWASKELTSSPDIELQSMEDTGRNLQSNANTDLAHSQSPLRSDDGTFGSISAGTQRRSPEPGKVVILEMDDAYIRAGFSNKKHFPSCEFPAIVGRLVVMAPSQAEGLPSDVAAGSINGTFVGDQCLKIRHLLDITHPVCTRGNVRDWEGMFLLWDHAFRLLGLDFLMQEYRICISYQIPCRADYLYRVAQAMFVRYHFHSVCFCEAASMVLWQRALLTGVVVDVGESFTRIIPVLELYAMSSQMKVLPYGSRKITECASLHSFRSICHDVSSPFDFFQKSDGIAFPPWLPVLSQEQPSRCY